MISEHDPRLRYRVEDQSDYLLDRAEKAVENVQNTDLAPDQVQGLLRQAQTGYGVEHVCNWLRYQQARVEEWRTSGLAKAVLKNLNDLRREAETIAGAIEPARAKEWQPVVWLALARRYAAYLERCYWVERKKREQNEG
ncbi:MAG TPA: hypothetical protein EYH32_05960 [Anaerolineae bacterium]|nr:hypothetical protein [Anaerolineae bacterium]